MIYSVNPALVVFKFVTSFIVLGIILAGSLSIVCDTSTEYTLVKLENKNRAHEIFIHHDS